IQAWIKDKILTIDWSSIHETNNHHFEIEVSTDGSAFTKVATVASKAPGGNSTTALQYTFNLGLSDAPELIGMLLLGYILVGIRRSRYIHGLTMVVVLGFFTISSCSKNDMPAQGAIPGKA